jgi:antitoxin (DNA-binding transcriptional repressor) of toxin-antitoxin stability system
VKRYVKPSAFKAECLAAIDQAARNGALLTILKNGKPVAEFVPCRPRRQSPFGILKDELFITGDIVSPIDVEWEVLK